MSKNPFLNALGAVGYIFLVVFIINFLSTTLGNKPDTAFAPVLALSLLTLSVVVMAILFFYRPLMIFIEGQKKEAVLLFVRTVGVFAIFTIIVLLLLLLGLI